MENKIYMMDNKKLIERLRTESLYKDKATLEIMDLCMDAANALAVLMEENARLRGELQRVKRERDAAVRAVKTSCGCWECAIRQESGCTMAFCVIGECEHWAWRGPQKEDQ